MNFFYKYKKFLIAILFIIIIFGLGYAIYFLFLKPITSPPGQEPEPVATVPSGLPTPEDSDFVPDDGTETGVPEEPGLPEAKPSEVAYGGLTKTTRLNSDVSISPTLSPNGDDLQYYNKNDGKFYKIDKNGKIVELSDQVFHDVEKITWSPQKDKAIIEYPDGANIFYDFSNQKQVTLPKHWEDFDYSPTGDQLVLKSLGLDPNNRWLAVSNEDGSKVSAIEPIGNNDANVYSSWSPNNQIIAMHTEGIDFNRQKVYFVGLNDENFKSTTIEGRGFEPKWSKEGDRLLYSVYSSDNDLKPNLWAVNAVGDNIGTGRKNLNIETWANKCTYINNTEIYCAVPENMEKGAGLFPELSKYSRDKLYKINTMTGLKKLVAVPDESYNMSNLIVSENGYNLYFTDETTRQIYKIRLK